jgi:hypothetical protein
MILSLFLGLIASLLGGLSVLLVALLFGSITAFAIVMTTPIPEKPTREYPEYREHGEHHEHHKHHKHHEKGDYQSLPFTVVVDPSHNNTVTEHFVNGGSSMHSIQPYSAEPHGVVEVDATSYSGPSLPDYTPPTSKNLFMNVLLDEYKYNPDRPEAAPIGNPTIKQTLDDFFRVHWYSDPTDVFGKNQNQRQFVTQPSTTVPNDQGSFANWLYKIPGKTCKEGGRAACLAGTDGAAMPWLSHAS